MAVLPGVGDQKVCLLFELGNGGSTCKSHPWFYYSLFVFCKVHNADEIYFYNTGSSGDASLAVS